MTYSTYETLRTERQLLLSTISPDRTAEKVDRIRSCAAKSVDWDYLFVEVSVDGGQENTPPKGAALVPDTDTDLSRKPGDIDFSETSPPAGYNMKWHTCGDIEYDVRWNIAQISTRSRLVTVAARQQIFSRNNVKMYAPPVTLRTISGP